MSDWDALAAELDAHAEAGRAADFWWRDDDAGEITAALERLLALAAESNAPLMLAVIPDTAEPALAGMLDALDRVSVAQHGYAHRNYAPDGDKKMELGGHRPAEIVIGELAAGRQRLETLFGARALPVMVPPWNRIAPHVVPMLPEMAYAGLSQFGPRERAEPVPGFLKVNTHIDIIDWKGGRGFAGEAAALGQAVSHLAAKRAGAADPDEPTGLLTHHRAHDGAAWQFTAAFVDLVTRHPAARWHAAPALFGTEAGR